MLPVYHTPLSTGRGCPTGRLRHCDLDRNGTTDRIFAYGAADDHAVLGDLDGDGFDDIAITRNYNGVLAWHVDTNRDGVTDQIFAYGAANDWGVAGNIREARP